jgi:UDP-N-acetylglucosamine:LPS N-acetylglucosamine transferase
VTETEIAKDPAVLVERIEALLEKPEERSKLGKNLAAFAHPDAAHHLAMILLEQA